ncbi:hypothetical protein [Myroides sp. WP-1]|uniref:hypothetical protein n=1 Tax=Myroides sp. WP-1 TaxID=2759944 RepID=UPI0015F86364|nr:hypothetical protein [Myroides sp. WP-1]MBB1139568.1 hypothetical protein [Myroides sp. WP-1]
MNKIEVLFSSRAINRGGILLFSKRDALDFIEQCKYFEIVILGIDGFFISESLTQPSLEDSIDYSGTLSISGIYEKALEFVNNRDANLYFEIICE